MAPVVGRIFIPVVPFTSPNFVPVTPRKRYEISMPLLVRNNFSQSSCQHWHEENSYHIGVSLSIVTFVLFQRQNRYEIFSYQIKLWNFVPFLIPILYKNYNLKLPLKNFLSKWWSNLYVNKDIDWKYYSYQFYYFIFRTIILVRNFGHQKKMSVLGCGESASKEPQRKHGHQCRGFGFRLRTAKNTKRFIIFGYWTFWNFLLGNRRPGA